MAKVKNPLNSAEARGGISGLVYNTWRGISTVKVGTSPTGQGTAKRLIAQGLMTNVSKLWAGITQAQRDAWNAYALVHLMPDWTGNNKRLTGMNWFCMCNIHLTRLGIATISDAPEIAPPAAPSGVVLAPTGGNLTIAHTTPATTAEWLDLHIVGPHSPGEIGKLEMAKFLTATLSTVTVASIIVTSAAAGRYTVFAKAINAATGLPGPYVSSFTIAP